MTFDLISIIYANIQNLLCNYSPLPSYHSHQVSSKSYFTLQRRNNLGMLNSIFS